MNLTSRQVELFWQKVDKTESCWNWIASVGWNGYGMFGKPTKRAHLVALHLAGVTLKSGELGLHKCNNRRCVRVDPCHVYVGDNRQNCADRKASGFIPTVPWVPGELNGEAKLTEEKVLMIRKFYSNGRSGRAKRITTHELATMFLIGDSQIKRILNYQSWKHV